MMKGFNVLGSNGSVMLEIPYGDSVTGWVYEHYAPNYVSISLIRTYWLSFLQQQLEYQLAVAFQLCVCYWCMQ